MVEDEEVRGPGLALPSSVVYVKTLCVKSSPCKGLFEMDDFPHEWSRQVSGRLWWSPRPVPCLKRVALPQHLPVNAM